MKVPRTGTTLVPPDDDAAVAVARNAANDRDELSEFVPIETIRHEAREFAERSRADSTHRAYRQAWSDFVAWCEQRGFPSLPAPPQAVAYFITERARHPRPRTRRPFKWPSVQRALAAIGYYHRLARSKSPNPDAVAIPTRHPIVREVVSGIRRELGVDSDGAPALSVTQLRTIVTALPDDLQGNRDRAIIVVGFAGAFRRSEIGDMNVSDLVWAEDSVDVRLRKSKTNQEKRRERVMLLAGAHPETCPLRALRAWLDASGIDSGPVFRAVRGEHVSDRRMDTDARMVARVVKRACDRAGIKLPKGWDGREFSAHSLRAGFVTAAAKSGVPPWEIKKVTRAGSSGTEDRIVILARIRAEIISHFASTCYPTPTD